MSDSQMAEQQVGLGRQLPGLKGSNTGHLCPALWEHALRQNLLDCRRSASLETPLTAYSSQSHCTSSARSQAIDVYRPSLHV